MNKIVSGVAVAIFSLGVCVFFVQSIGWQWPGFAVQNLSQEGQVADVSAGTLGGTEPLISLIGANPLYLTVGQNFNSVDPGVTFAPSKPSYYLSGVRRDGGNIDGGWDVDTSQPTTLNITYKLTECTANSCGTDPSTIIGSSIVTRQVIITAPQTAPVNVPTSPVTPTTPVVPVTSPSPAPTAATPKVTLFGANPLYIQVGQNFNAFDPGATASLGNPGDYLSGIRRGGGNIDNGWDVDTSKPTTLAITYTVSECAANSCGSTPGGILGSATATRQVVIGGGSSNVPTVPVVPITLAPITPTTPVTPITLATSTMITAASCNEADVQRALDSVAVDGTTVMIPAGTCHWATPMTYNQVYSTIIKGAGAKTPAGGTDKTLIIDDVNHNGSDPAMLQINTAAGKAFRLTGIAISTDAANTSVAYNGIVVIGGKSQEFRIDNDHFILSTLAEGINFQGWNYGVVDHSLFDSPVGSVHTDLRFGEPSWNDDTTGYGNASWADYSYFGTGKFVFAEGNTFNGGYALDCSNGGRFVFRDNISNGANLQTHGLSFDVRAGCRAMEIYGNTFTYSTHPIDDNFAFTLMLESGSGMFWNNTITGYLQFIHEDTVRTNSATYSYLGVPAGWGYCGTSVTGALSPWDGNTDSTGYPCLQQVGRGKGDMIVGSSFPNIVNAVTGVQSQTHEALDPAYVWNNKYNAVPQESYDALWANIDSATKENRDYYLQLPNYNEPAAVFNGSAGVGSGLLSARPSICTANVGYWATDTKTLYQCSSGNTWTPHYQPYVCPNPLITSGFTADASGKIDASYCTN